MNHTALKINQIQENFFAVCRYWGSLNSSLRQIESIQAMSTGVAVSDTNWVWNDKPLIKNSENSVAEIKDYYRKLNLRFWWWVYPCGQSPETGKILQEAGLRLFETVPCMAADLDDSLPQIETPEDIKIFPVKNSAELLAWETVAFHGFEMPPHVREQFHAFVSSFEMGVQSPQKLFLGYVKGIPAATSLLFTSHDSAGIYYVSTLPAYRNKGCGLSVTMAAMRSAKESGFKDVILQATPMGRKVYIKAGFREYCRAEIYKLSSKKL